MSYRIAPIGEADLPEYFHHCLKVTTQSGVDGTPLFHPFDDRSPFQNPDPKEFSGKFRIPTDAVGWRRTFALFYKGAIVGDLDFYGKPIHSSLHRAMIGMGIQRDHTGKGQGAKLLAHGIEWAKTQPAISYLDLRVFGSNAPALGLYRKFGFEIVGTIPDGFRIRGQRIDDIFMSLRLRD